MDAFSGALAPYSPLKSKQMKVTLLGVLGAAETLADAPDRDKIGRSDAMQTLARLIARGARRDRR